ncbi:Uncharacterised protein [Segatella copri]|nr:Uncharacterised protein [Segatella copri]
MHFGRDDHADAEVLLYQLLHLAVLLARVGGDNGGEVLQFSLIYELAQFLGVEFLSELLQ